jgi:hypothetical protein
MARGSVSADGSSVSALRGILDGPVLSSTAVPTRWGNGAILTRASWVGVVQLTGRIGSVRDQSRLGHASDRCAPHDRGRPDADHRRFSLRNGGHAVADIAAVIGRRLGCASNRVQGIISARCLPQINRRPVRIPARRSTGHPRTHGCSRTSKAFDPSRERTGRRRSR